MCEWLFAKMRHLAFGRKLAVTFLSFIPSLRSLFASLGGALGSCEKHFKIYSLLWHVQPT